MHGWSLEREAANGGMWLAAFRLATQVLSWASTIIVARILVPESYGLMGMAMILIGYGTLFSEIGLGGAIVQRENVTDDELSSLFWFLALWGLILTLACMVLSYPAAYLLKEERIIPLIKSVAVIYVVGSFAIVPLYILNRHLRFKIIGAIEAVSVLVASVSMIVIAGRGGGVWTLVGGAIVRELTRSLLFVAASPWKPAIHFELEQIKPYLKFGIRIAGANSVGYATMTSDTFFGSRALGAGTIGFYSMALQLASIPTDKLISLINYVSFPVFSRYQNSHGQFVGFYLKLVNMIAFIAFPIYVGAFFVADELIPALLGPQWIPLIVPFKIICLAQIIISATTPTVPMLNALGLPHWTLRVAIVGIMVVPPSFYIASKFGLNALAVPWVTVYQALRIGANWVVLRKLAIPIGDVLRSVKHPAFATLGMFCALLLVKYCYFCVFSAPAPPKPYLVTVVMIGVLVYASYLAAFQRSMLTSLLALRRAAIHDGRLEGQGGY